MKLRGVPYIDVSVSDLYMHSHHRSTYSAAGK
jgi:hypothetical protein